MQYNASTPIEYLAALDHDWRKEKLLQLRTIVKTKAPSLEEGIEYKMLSYGDERGTVFHLNAQKHHVGLYVGNANKIDTDGTLLQGLDLGKGCIRFKKSVAVDEARIGEFVERAVDLWKRGKDIGC